MPAQPCCTTHCCTRATRPGPDMRPMPLLTARGEGGAKACSGVESAAQPCAKCASGRGGSGAGPARSEFPSGRLAKAGGTGAGVAKWAGVAASPAAKLQWTAGVAGLECGSGSGPASMAATARCMELRGGGACARKRRSEHCRRCSVGAGGTSTSCEAAAAASCSCWPSFNSSTRWLSREISADVRSGSGGACAGSSRASNASSKQRW
mmetsp:Transcript_61035/g.196638  ORF Transcript_61035/g.196638 Transcript_61035/m.196638 type:complete len:208 (+) Transcript_61035:217-840(+)